MLEWPRLDPETGRDRDQGRLAPSTTPRPRRVTLTTIFEEGGQGEPPRRWVRRDRLRLVVAPTSCAAFAEDAGLDRRAASPAATTSGRMGPGSERAILVAVKP